MNTLLHELNLIFSNAFQAAFADNQTAIDALVITPSTQPQFGDYQCNSAMRLAKLLGKAPRDIATLIIEQVKQQPKHDELIAKLEVAGPGFINIHLSTETLAKRCQLLATSPQLGIDASAHTAQRVVIDFSSPNTAKEMHVGHLRSTIIGDALARVFEFLGYQVLRLNHIGDWGTAFGMLITYLQQQQPDVLSGKKPAELPDLVQWYKASKVQFDNDDAFKKQAQLAVVALQRGDAAERQAWEIICRISREAYQHIYNRLHIDLIERGESFYNDDLPGIIDALEKKQLIELSDGAKCVFLPGYKNRDGNPLPFMVQKSDGGYNYSSTDLAAIKQRAEQEKADRIIYVTDAGQATHFAMLFDCAKAADFLDQRDIQLDHVPFGLVLGPDGKKFKTRSGDTVKLSDLLDTAVSKAHTLLKQRNEDWPDDEVQHAAEVLGISAIKYADLSSNRSSNYQFSFDNMLQFEGNTAAFLLYSYVRIQSIKRKVDTDIDALSQNTAIELAHESERTLGLAINQFAEVLDKVADELLPNRLCDYLYQLAEQFNAFFRDCRIAGDPQQNSRLLLAELCGRTLKTGLSLLGIDTLDRM